MTKPSGILILRRHLAIKSLRRYLQHTLVTLIGREIIAGQVESGADLTVDVKDGALVVLSRERAE